MNRTEWWAIGQIWQDTVFDPQQMHLYKLAQRDKMEVLWKIQIQRKEQKF